MAAGGYNPTWKAEMKIITIYTMETDAFRGNERIRLSFETALFRQTHHGVEFQIDNKGYMIPWSQIKQIVTSYGETNG